MDNIRLPATLVNGLGLDAKPGTHRRRGGRHDLGVMPPTGTDPRLAAVLRREREKQGLSQERLAHKADMSADSYARVERGQSGPAWTSVVRLADALGLGLAKLGRLVEAEK